MKNSRVNLVNNANVMLKLFERKKNYQWFFISLSMSDWILKSKADCTFFYSHTHVGSLINFIWCVIFAKFIEFTNFKLMLCVWWFWINFVNEQSQNFKLFKSLKTQSRIRSKINLQITQYKTFFSFLFWAYFSELNCL